MKNVNLISSGLLCGGLLAFAGCATSPNHAGIPAKQLGPLKLFWNGHDNFTTATAQGETDAKTAGYNFVRIEGYIFASPQPGTVPLKQYWSAPRQDNWLMTGNIPKNVEKNGAYKFVRIEGYVFPDAQPGTVPLKLFSRVRGDNFTTPTVKGEQDALAAGYGFRRVVAYVMESPHVPMQTNYRAGINSNGTATAPQKVKIEKISGGRIKKWIAQLGDPDFSKREDAVNALAQHSDLALSALEQALKKETGDRHWWIQAAIQECQRSQRND